MAALATSRLASALVDTARETSKLSAVFANVTGSAQAANREMAFAADLAEKYGASVTVLSSALASFEAAAKTSNLTITQTRQIFESVVKASGALGLSADETRGALLALQQMMSKGTVSAEELRGQLGERLPGAFQLAANAMGVTTSELGKMLQQGQVVSDDFLPKFSAELDKAFSDARFNNINSNINRLSNAWFELKKALVDRAFGDIFAKTIREITEAIRDLTLLLEKGPRAFDDFRQAFDALNEAALRVQITILELQKTFLRIIELDLTFDPTQFFGDTTLDSVRQQINLVTEDIDDLQKKLFEIQQSGFSRDLLADMKKFADSLIKAGKSAEQVKEALDLAFGAQAKYPGLEKQIDLYIDIQTEARKAAKSVDDLNTAIGGSAGAAFEQNGVAGAAFEQNFAKSFKKAIAKVGTEVIPEAQAVFEDAFRDPFEKLPEEARKSTDKTVQIFEDAATNINRSFTDTFREMLDTGEFNFKDFGKRLLDIFKDILAQMATLAIAKPIIAPIVSGVGNTLGVSQSSIQSVLGQLGINAAPAVTSTKPVTAKTAGGQNQPSNLTQQAAGTGASAIASSKNAALATSLGGVFSAGIGVGANLLLDRFLSGRIGPASSTALSAVGGIAAGGAAAGILGAAGVSGLGEVGAAGAAAGSTLGAAGAGAGSALGAIPLVGWIALAALALWKGGFFKERSLKTFGLQGIKDIADQLGSSTLGKILAPDVALANSDSGFRFASPVFPIALALKPLLDILSSEKRPRLTLFTQPKDDLLARQGGNFFADFEQGRILADRVGGTKSRGTLRQSPFGATGIFFSRVGGNGSLPEKNITPLDPVADAIAAIDKALANLAPERVASIREQFLGLQGIFRLRNELKPGKPVLDQFALERTTRLFDLFGGKVNDLFKKLLGTSEKLEEVLNSASAAVSITEFERQVEVSNRFHNVLISLSGDMETLGRSLTAFQAIDRIFPGVIESFADLKPILGKYRKENEVLAETFARGVDTANKLKTAFSGLNLGINDLASVALGVSQTDASSQELQGFIERFVPQQEIVQKLQEAFFREFQRQLKPFFFLSCLYGSERRQRHQAPAA